MSMVTRFWLWSLLVVCGLLTPAVPAQSPAKPRDTPTQIDGVSVDDVLERLGAQLEQGAEMTESSPSTAQASLSTAQAGGAPVLAWSI